MTTTARRDAFWSLLVEFAAEHAQPDGPTCADYPDHCRLKIELSTQFDELTTREDAEELLDWLVSLVLREGTAIAHTWREDGDIGLAGFRFSGVLTAGMLAAALLMGHSRGNKELKAAALTLLRFAPPVTARSVLACLVEQLVSGLVERHQQMTGTKADA